MSAATRLPPASLDLLALIGDELSAAEAAGVLSDDLLARCSQAGLFGMAVPVEHGGSGAPLVERVHLHAEVARLSPSLHSVLIVHEMAVHAIARFGAASVAQRWLGAMARGEVLGAFALTEPDGGSSFDQLGMTATVTTEGIRLQGVKAWISSGLRAGVVVAFAVADDGPVAVAVDMATPGVRATAAPELVAFRATSMARIELDGCMVPADSRLGGGGLGLLRVASTCLSIGRVLVASGACAVGGAAVDEIVTFSRNRVVGRGPLAERDLVRVAVADAHVQLAGARALLERAAVAIDEGNPEAHRLAIVAKLAASETAARITQDAVRLHGAYGLTAGAAVQHFAAAAAVYTCIEGSTEALSLALGASLLGQGRAA